MTKISFGEKWGKEFTNPSIQHYIHAMKNETILIFDKRDNDGISARPIIGIGKVMRVYKGEKLDLVYMNFGGKYNKKIVVFHNHARRQVYTLKRGQLATLYGYIRFYTENEQTKYSMYANGFHAWYVPKAFDIKNYDSDMLDQLTQENETSMLDFLDNIIGDDEQ